MLYSVSTPCLYLLSSSAVVRLFTLTDFVLHYSPGCSYRAYSNNDKPRVIIPEETCLLYSLIAFDKRVTFCLQCNLVSYCLVCVCLLLFMGVQLHNSYTQTSRANNATYAHAQGSDQAHLSQKLLSWKAIGL